MSVYVDASALVKRYVTEAGSADVVALTNGAAAVATALVTRAEVAAAFARAVRVGVLDDVSGRRAQRRFSREWPDVMRIHVTETLIALAETLAWAHGLRGYDAVQLASTVNWQDALGQEITGVQSPPDPAPVSSRHGPVCRGDDFPSHSAISRRPSSAPARLIPTEPSFANGAG